MAYDIFNKYSLEDIDDNASLTDTTASDWQQVAVKSVQDADGFMTDYTWYTNGDVHIFMFGDSDVVEPDEAYADWTCETESEAEEWFSTYTGFEEDETDSTSFFDLDESILAESYNNFPQWLVTFLDTHRDGRSIKNILTKRHVDLHNATYIRAPFPRSNRDPILKDESKIKIFKLMQGSVEIIYVFGVNNPYLRRPNISEWRYANDMPMKDILDLAIEFGYIDMSNDSNSNYSIQSQRRDLTYSLRDITRYPENGQHAVYHHEYGRLENGRPDYNNIIKTTVSWVTKNGYDKSGYKLNPDKYVKMLNDVDLTTYADRLQSFYNQIESLRTRIIVLMNELQFDGNYVYRSNSSFNQNIFGDVADAVEYMSRSMDYYQRIKRACVEIVDAKDADETENVDHMLKYAFGYDADSFRENIKRAKDLVVALEAAKIKQ